MHEKLLEFDCMKKTYFCIFEIRIFFNFLKTFREKRVLLCQYLIL